MPDRLLTTDQILSLLRENPKRISAITAGLTPPELRKRPGRDAWSPNDVLAHVRSCADVWGDCIAAILAEEKPTLRAVNPRTWIKTTDYPDQEFHSSLRAFVAQRTRLLKVLTALSPSAWSRPATVIGAGAPLQRTVHLYAQWLATHERSHVKQIARIAASARTPS